MSLYNNIAYRQSNDPFMPNTWFVFDKSKSGTSAVIDTCHSEAEAIRTLKT